MKRKWIILSIIAIFLTTVIGCIVKVLRADDRPKVVVVLKDLNTEYWSIVKAGAEKGFQAFDIDGKVVSPRYKSKKDTLESILENVLKEHPDVLVVSPEESPAVMSILKKIAEHNIPVLLVDTDIPLEHKTSYIGTDNYELGRKAGELLASGLQPGDKVAFPLIAEDVTRLVLSKRVQGAKSSLEDGGIKIVEEQVKFPNNPLSIKQAMTRILQKNPDVKGIFATTDTNALIALKVVQDYGLKIPATGADGIIKMVKSIEDGTVTSTVAQNPYDMGYISIQTALKVIKGEEVERNIDTGVDIITKDNAKVKLDFLNSLLGSDAKNLK